MVSTVVRNLEIGVLVGAGIIAAALIGIAALTYTNATQLRNDAAAVAHSREILDLSTNVMLTLVDAETGMRAFIVTGEEKSLDPYYAAKRRIDVELRELFDKTNDPERQKQVDDLTDMAHKKMAFLEKTIERRRTDATVANFSEAMVAGKTEMDAIRRQV